MSPPRSILSARSLSKAYAEPVLDGVNLDVASGEVHALVGENGAGKSTLARIIGGIVPPDSGSLLRDGQPYAPASRKDAEAAGVRLVMQELNLIHTLSVAENIFLDQLPHRRGWIRYRDLHARSHEVLARLGLDLLDPSTPVSQLSIGQQQLVEIAAGLSRRCDLLILDEPTAALTERETDLLFTQIQKLRGDGVSFLYISHRLEEIRRIADRITILRDGQQVSTTPLAALSDDEIVRRMVGRSISHASEMHPPQPAIALRVQALTRRPAVNDVSFDVRAGEILGFAGLLGSGRTETMRLIFGADLAESGRVFVGTPQRSMPLGSPAAAVNHGIAFLTEDRKQQGLLLPLSLTQNISLPNLPMLSRAGWVEPSAEKAASQRWVERFQIRCHSLDQPVAQLSGGNQQKVVLAKWLLRDCSILICAEPTRGIDVGARFEIHDFLTKLAAQGQAILLVSSDLKELMALCHRILVMAAGRITGEFTRPAWSQDAILNAALHLPAATRPFPQDSPPRL